MTKLRESVRWFAEECERVLQRNDYKGGWRHLSTEYLIGRMYGEVGEVIDSVERDAREHIIRECCDVANFAMMLADNMRQE